MHAAAAAAEPEAGALDEERILEAVLRETAMTMPLTLMVLFFIRYLHHGDIVYFTFSIGPG
jgi:hypothetical protein